ncbi:MULTISPECIES: phosphoadenosine phosphosulfate reductase domain-containing protein [Mycobacterium avium complex (MAC)]|uniref:Phosphoadenosine phosphosulfate reductase family protein n=1 Tax=Mycobacterium intracellulare subsp. chimaera TaxID=222805 RepID=A0ABT7P3L5_MYCIT|nr:MULTISPECIES: phosphoadenosine phosphosulfate reductase family protein [Mycobacterium avium complex (MAC)]AOS94728.1 phosphoadenosine phosphosulfate reductase [Mycobacterium intracellulare subsp. chimaera]MDM3927869.1 phosphoadenosine phosphosulfate reductase family protein [Mycobacterium intracellulare subsp. chimaera]PBA69169.1 phosphoadenosine phosphosulfate reductase [Mycobacterium avium]
MRGPFDVDALRAIRARRRGPSAHRHLLDRIAEHLECNDGFVAWSGGKDSTTVVDLARQVDPNIPVVFYDSGLQFPETLAYMGELAQIWRLNFEVIPAEPDLLTVFIAAGGFDHRAPDRDLAGTLANILISGPAAQAHARHGRGSLWGVRSQESSGRRHLYRTQLARQARAHDVFVDRAGARQRFGGTVHRVDGTITYGPIWDWQTSHVFEYLAGRGIPPNPLYRKLAHLGAPPSLIRVDSIIDAAKLSNGHITWLQKGWPDLFDRLSAALPRLREWA